MVTRKHGKLNAFKLLTRNERQTAKNRRKTPGKAVNMLAFALELYKNTGCLYKQRWITPVICHDQAYRPPGTDPEPDQGSN